MQLKHVPVGVGERGDVAHTRIDGPAGKDDSFGLELCARCLDVGGVGLGLARSRSIARSHGGELALDVRARGLVAILSLPAVTVEPYAQSRL